MKRLVTISTLVLAMTIFAGIATSQERQQNTTPAPDQATVEQIIATWKRQPQAVARQMIAKYGQPHEATAQRIIWHNNGPWKRTELINEEIPHNFPKPHKDMLLQVINYQTPAEKFDELATYDGSVIAERTRGELAARCDKEEANFLALNLANDIVNGKKTVEEARQFYAEAVMEKKHPEYMQGFVFDVARTNLGDPGQQVTLASR
jgi:hypothetical protein